MALIPEPKKRVLKSQVTLDEFTDKVSKCFDYEFDGTSTFTCLDLNKDHLPTDFNIGLIVGSSGSGKSTLLKDFGTVEEISWDNTKAIVSNFNNPDEAIDRLSAVGLNSIPSWVKPFKALSNGEAFRADLARRIKDGAVIDEFTSVVDRNVARACCVSISKFIHKKDIKGVVFASCHRDIIDWLTPNWVYDTDEQRLLLRGSVRRPTIEIEIHKASRDIWRMFRNFHYLDTSLNKSAECYVGIWGNEPVCFQSILAMPGKIPPLYKGDKRLKYREHRLVVLPDFQGMGIGTRFSNAIGEMYLNKGYRYFSRTAHIRMGEYREQSDLWRATDSNLKLATENKIRTWHNYHRDITRICYSHEYIGSEDNKYRKLYEESLK